MASNNGNGTKPVKSLEETIMANAMKTTGKWAKQRKKEERNVSKASMRRACFRETSNRVTIKEVVYRHMEEIYNVVSGDGTTPAYARQLFYRMRPIVEQEAEPENELKMNYFSQTLLPDYIAEHNCGHWLVSYDDRGHFKMPHRCADDGEELGCGTIAVNNYINEVKRHKITVDDFGQFKIPTAFNTRGPKNRCSAILFIEKEGFFPLFEHAKLCERYDLALLSTKGQSVTASRALVDYMCGQLGCPLIVFRDFDAYGIRILKTLVTSNRRYRFRNKIKYIDGGLCLSDVEEWSLEAENCTRPSIDSDLKKWMTGEEYEFLRGGQRVELNAFTSPDLIAFIESKLEENGIKKVVPNDHILEAAYRRTSAIMWLNEESKKLADDAKKHAADAAIPDDLRKRIDAELQENPEFSWTRPSSR